MKHREAWHVLAGVLVSGWLAVAGATPLPAGPAASASVLPGRHVSPYMRAAQQHAQEASAAPPKVNPLMQHRPRMPSSLRRG